MEPYVTYLRLSGLALGALGGGLLFIEFFQLPSYVEYKERYGDYKLDLSPDEMQQYTPFGRVGALLISLSFALQFIAVFLE